MPDALTLTTGARLHFGLIRFGQGAGREFGGIGAMIASPELRLTARRADNFSASGPLAERVTRFAEAWQRWHRLPALPPLAIEVLAAPPEHSGLGVGTQLGLAVARALETLTEIGPCLLAETAQSVGRGKRSAIGVHGFEQGGLIYETGKLPDEPLSPLAARVPLPESWRFLLFRPRKPTLGLAGETEQRAFAHLLPVPESTAARLTALAERELVPAARSADFARFAAALGEYNRLSGSCYKSSQGGPYCSLSAEALIARLHAAGLAGAGQSSWGPTLFAPVESPASAADRAERLRELEPDWELILAAPRNEGATAKMPAAGERS